MWQSALSSTDQPVTTAFLRKHVLPNWGAGFEKVTAAMAVRKALCANVRPEKNLVVCVPGGTERTALYVTAGLLVGDFAHRRGGAGLPAGENGALFSRDVLLVTQAVTPSKKSLEELKLAATQELSSIWEVAPLSRYTSRKTTRPRVFIANPGWVGNKLPERGFSAVVIDATHPRGLSMLKEVLSGPLRNTPLRVVVVPAVGKDLLAACGFPNSADTWFWDPQAKRAADTLVGKPSSALAVLPARIVWVCDEDEEGSQALERICERLGAALQQAGGRALPGFRLAWGIYNRLRLLSVPMVELEQLTQGTWAGNLRARTEALAKVEGHANPAWELAWPALRAEIEATYALFLKRKEPAKFWVLASRVEAWLRRESKDGYRIVVPSHAEVTLLSDLLEITVDGAKAAMAEGYIEVVTPAEDASLCAKGQFAHTLLCGPRVAQYRYLDVYPLREIEELAYPFEARLERTTQQGLYEFVASLADEGRRADVLTRLGFSCTPDGSGDRSQSPEIRCLKGDGREVRISAASATKGSIDLDLLAAAPYAEAEFDPSAPDDLRSVCGGAPTGYVEIRFSDGSVERYPESYRVDVFFSATDTLQRHCVRDLRPGWEIVRFVDGRYDNLFRRLTEAIEVRLHPRERAALALWRTAKEKAVARFAGDRSALLDELRRAGLTSDYATVLSWFREDEDDEVLAPQQEADYLVLAKVTGAFPDERLMKSTFRSIQHHRGRNRQAGRVLRQLLRAIRTGDGYEDALESARKFDAALGDMLAAVELLEVTAVGAAKTPDLALEL